MNFLVLAFSTSIVTMNAITTDIMMPIIRPSGVIGSGYFELDSPAFCVQNYLILYKMPNILLKNPHKYCAEKLILRKKTHLAGC